MKAQPNSQLNKQVVDATLQVWSKTNRQTVLPVQGTSMFPLLQPGDTIILSHGRADFQEGDIVVFQQGDQIITHRLLSIRPGGTIQTAGDNRPNVDDLVPMENVLGKVMAINTPKGSIRLETRVAKALFRLLVFCYPLHQYSLLRKLAALVNHFSARVLRP